MTATSFPDDGVLLRRNLFQELRLAGDDVREAAADTEHGLAHSVHEYRKGLRRARALLRLVWRSLGKDDRKELETALRSARRSLGAARDHAVAADVLGAVEGEREREIAKAIIDGAATCAQSSAEVRQLLVEGATRTAAQLELLDSALPARVELRTVLDGLRKTYGRARDARRDAKRSRRSFHTWRRRCKELAIQLEVLGRLVSPELAELRKEIVAATEDLGDAVDLLMARDFVRTHAAGIDKADVDLLVRALTRHLDVKIRDTRRASRDAFAKKPRDLARKLAKQSPLDVTPVAAPPLARAEEFAVT